jgi:GDP-4-dehydro-6-deoxy-D-mannose reductase
MPAALITGVSGFVGSHLAEATKLAGFTVVGLDVKGTPSPVDLRDVERIRSLVREARPEVVFHLAGLLRAPSPAALYESNVSGTVNLLEALVAEGLSPRVVVASSSAVYGSPADDNLLTEASPLRPLTHYGASKAAQEHAALAFFSTAKLQVMIARIFNIVGPGQPATLAAGAFAEQVASAERTMNRELKVGDLSGARDFVDVRDVARAYLALARSGQPGEIYNVCSSQRTPMQSCVDTLVSLASVRLAVVHDPTRARTNDVRAQIGDPARIRATTGWRAEISFEQSMKDLLESWRRK